MKETPAESRLWDFSVEIYGRSGVADACLWLQDRHGVDVNHLLFLIWAGLVRGRLEGELFDRSLAFSRDWSENVVGKLRAVRRWLKTAGCAALDGAQAARCRAAREGIVERERQAEKLQQEVLERMIGDLPAARQDRSAAARSNVDRYLSALGVEPDEAIDARLDAIFASALGGPERG